MQLSTISAEDTLLIRQRLLRPNLPIDTCRFEGDNDPTTHHVGGFIHAHLIGIVSLYQRSHPSRPSLRGGQIRAMAVLPEHQGKDIGRRLLLAAEQTARDVAMDYLWANARIAALGFYQKCGYTIEGDDFMIEGVGWHKTIILTL